MTSITNKAKRTSTKKPSKVAKKSKKKEGKPKRPLSAYNIFFQKERERIVREAIKKDNPAEEDVSEWLKSGKDRPHRKTHGKISFINLAKQVGAKWKKLTPEERSEFELHAEGEQLRYHEAMRHWKNEQDAKIIQERKLAHEEKCAAAMQNKKGNMEMTTKPDTIANFMTAAKPTLKTTNSSLIGLPHHHTSSEINLNIHDSQEFSPEAFDWTSNNAALNTAPFGSAQLQSEGNHTAVTNTDTATLAGKSSPIYSNLQALQQLQKMHQLKKTMTELSSIIQQVNTIYEQAFRQMESNGYSSEAIMAMHQQQENAEQRQASIANMSQGLSNNNSDSSSAGAFVLGDDVSVMANTFTNEDEPPRSFLANRRDSLEFNFF